MKCDIVKLDSNGEVIQVLLKKERVYLAHETGWGVQSKRKQVIGHNGAKHVYLRKANDESRKTLMLGICKNGEVIKPLTILEKSFPLVGEGESDHILQEILLCKTDKGLWKKMLFASDLKIV